uniref:Beta-defensin-like domain-containing protein n=1 Tax=Zosterops lateralis melanops TaxID=1220523 RepID=A0A8D2NXZ3_ZOSLA
WNVRSLCLPDVVVQAEVGNAAGSQHRSSNSYCWIHNGFCSSLVCPSGSKVIGRCSTNLVCCKK